MDPKSESRFSPWRIKGGIGSVSKISDINLPSDGIVGKDFSCVLRDKVVLYPVMEDTC
jgi:hypothetical protein